MSTLHGIELVQASVDADGTFDEAARVLADSRLPAIAVLEDGKVVGLFTDEELLRGVSPRYLDELRHTAFLESEVPLQEHAAAVRDEPVRKHMRKPIAVEVDTSSLHAAERFVHCEEGALAVVDQDDRFLGMLSRAEFAYAMLRRLTES